MHHDNAYNALFLECLHFLFLECGGTIFSQNGSISSPSYSDPYKREEKDCIWVLNIDKTHKTTAHSTKTITLSFEEFDVGLKNPMTGNCEGDYLEIREGKGFLSPFLGRFCGYGTPHSITTFSESLYVRFHTTSQVLGMEDRIPRFKLQYKTDGISRIFYDPSELVV